MSYLVPLVSNLIVKLEIEKENDLKQLKEKGYIKASGKKRASNGPVLLIVCSSCRNAQRIHEIVNDMVDIAHRARCKDYGTSMKKLKTILLQGGGFEGKNFRHIYKIYSFKR